MDSSLFLGKILGLYLVIVGLAYILNRNFFQEMIRDFDKNTAVYLLGSIIALLFGLFIVVSHNVWEWSWRVVITVIGYLGLIKGVLLLNFPNGWKKVSKLFVHKEMNLYFGGISIVLGIFLLYHSF